MTEVRSTPAPAVPQPAPSVALEARGVGKRYPGVIALDSVSIRLQSGEIHALLGENGAGKSTLIGILSGIAQSDGGELLVAGERVSFGSVAAAQQAGVTTIYQEQSLAPDLTVLQNIFLGRELRGRRMWRPLLDKRAMRDRVAGLLDQFGLTPADLDRPAGELGALKQHVVQILKALAFDARVVILDEPTSGLEDHERLSLFEHMKTMRARGVAILWVTHRLDELFGLADVITVLRDGRQVATVDPREQDPESLIKLMVGRRIADTGDVAAAAAGSAQSGWTGPQDAVLQVHGLCRAGVLNDIDLTVRRGEVLGIAGIAGAGRTEVARAIMGADRIDTGTVTVNGQAVRVRGPGHAHRLGMALVPEERKSQAILAEFSLAKNISISRLSRVARGSWINRRQETERAAAYIEQLGVKTSGVGEKIRNLSGGNQQKVVIARCLFTQPSLLIFDEPTQGIDVAAKVEVYRLIYEFVDQGGAAVVISSELPELMRVSDRIVVMREGRITGEVTAGRRDAGLRDDDELAGRIMALATREVAA